MRKPGHSPFLRGGLVQTDQMNRIPATRREMLIARPDTRSSFEKGVHDGQVWQECTAVG